MKKSLIALAALATVAGAASAQSSVTLSGSVDLGVIRSNGQTTMGPAGSGRSGIALAGVEDLGGGLKAAFYLNHRFDLSTGNVNSSRVGSSTDDRAFWRQGWINLISDAAGDIRIGKMLPPVQEFNGGFEPWAGGDTVANVHTGGKYAGANNARYAKAVYYRTPRFAGLQVHGMIAAGESQGTAATSPERPVGVGIRYDGGPLAVALAYDKNQDDLKTTGVYGKYNFGMAEVMFQYERQDEPTPLAGEDKSKRWSVGAKVPAGAATFKIGYTRWKEEETRKFGVGVDYNLSKRTMLYADVAKLSGDLAGLAPNSSAAAIDDAKKTRFDIGVQHKF